MEGSFKGFKSSTPPATPRSPSYYGESNENEVNSDDSGSKINIPKKSSSSKKNFISPTKSARKRILKESSNFKNTHLQKNPNLDSKSSSKKSPSFNYSSDRNYEDQNSSITDSSLKPYDPLTNYLSPRPKFLRYNPNRRREIFVQRRLKHEIDDKRSLSFDTQKFVVEDELSICSSQESSVETGGDKIEQSEGGHFNDDDEDEEIEEFKEESGWSLKRVFDFLLVVAVLFLSTLYISTMNLPAPSYSVYESTWGGSGDGSLKIQNNFFDRVSMEILEGGNQTVLMELKMAVEDDMRFIQTSDEIVSNFEEVEEQLQVSEIEQKEDTANNEFEDSGQLQGTGSAKNVESFEDKNVEIKDEISSAKEGTWERDEDYISSSEFDEIITLGSILNKDEEPGTNIPEADSNVVITDQAQIDPIPIQITGVCLLVAFVGFLGFVYRSRKIRHSVVVEKNSPAVDDVETEKNKDFINPHSAVAAPMELSYSKYSVRKSNSKKSKMVEIEESSNSNSDSVSQENRGSLSYGSFTTEKKIVKKEKQEGKDGEVSMVITTPVRRSSRLLNRGIISP